MPIYEYEPDDDRDCGICNGRVEVIQAISDPPFKFCPWCGLGVRKIVSRATFKLDKSVTPDKAAKGGFTTFKKEGKGVWRRIAGEGPEAIVGTPEDIAAVEAERAPPPKVVDLDSEE